MNYSRIRYLALLTIVISAMTACNEDEFDTKPLNDVSEIVIFTHELYMETEILGGDEYTPLYVKNDGLIDQYVATVDDFDQLKQFPLNRLITCLLGVGLREEQIPQVRRSVMAYEYRNENLIAQHRRAMYQLNQGMEMRRDYWTAKYRSGEISAREYERIMQDLRKKYHRAVLKLKEKNAGEFRRSFRMLMQHLNRILDNSQWQNLIICLKIQ